MSRRVGIVCALALAASAAPIWAAAAAPDLRKGETIESVQIYPDHRRSGLFYYGPGDIELTVDEDGKPDFHLLSTRYVGTLASGDQGSFSQRNLASFKVALTGPTPSEVTATRAALKKRRRGRSLELRPLPIRRMLSQVVYVPANEEETRVLPQGQFEAAADQNQGYWSRRDYTLRLSAEDAQLLRSALEDGQVLLSLSYAFVADGIGMDAPLEEVWGSPAMMSLIDADERGTDGADQIGAHTVKADATGLTLDVAKWPGLLRQIDINEQAPPGYAALEIYCYDFQQAVREDLFEKRIDIEAESVTGTMVRQLAVFSVDDLDRYAHEVRFPVAVRLDRPYRYRVWETFIDGREELVTDWTERETWTALIDVTHVAEASPTSNWPDDAGKPDDVGEPEGVGEREGVGEDE